MIEFLLKETRITTNFRQGNFLCYDIFISVSGPQAISLTAETELKDTTVENLQFLGHASRTLPTDLQCSP